MLYFVTGLLVKGKWSGSSAIEVDSVEDVARHYMVVDIQWIVDGVGFQAKSVVEIIAKPEGLDRTAATIFIVYVAEERRFWAS